MLRDSPVEELEKGPPQQRLASSSLPDERMVTESTSPAPDHSRAHQALLMRVAVAGDVQPEEVQERSHRLMDILACSGHSRVALPINEGILEPVKFLWQTPSFLPPSAKSVERRYYVPSEGFEHFYNHPPPDSLVDAAANEKKRQGHQASTLKGKEAQRLDLFVRKLYFTGGLQFRIANQEALLGQYDFSLWDKS